MAHFQKQVELLSPVVYLSYLLIVIFLIMISKLKSFILSTGNIYAFDDQAPVLSMKLVIF